MSVLSSFAINTSDKHEEHFLRLVWGEQKDRTLHNVTS